MTTSAPLHMTGYLAPVPDEIDAVDLPVDGALPPELTGRYLRNGPNPLPGEPSRHWFTGHGMVHGIRLREGRAEWYRNRWVRTKALQGESMITPDGTVDRSVGVKRVHLKPIPGEDEIHDLSDAPDSLDACQQDVLDRRCIRFGPRSVYGDRLRGHVQNQILGIGEREDLDFSSAQ